MPTDHVGAYFADIGPHPPARKLALTPEAAWTLEELPLEAAARRSGMSYAWHSDRVPKSHHDEMRHLGSMNLDATPAGGTSDGSGATSVHSELEVLLQQLAGEDVCSTTAE